MKRDQEKKTNSFMEIKILALGDSYTIGEAVDTNERWPVQMADTLREKGYQVISPEIIAKTGWTTKELIEGIKLKNPQGTYEIVTLLIGVNNQYRHLDTTEYRKEFKELLSIAIGFAGKKESNVIVISIPDYGVTPFAINKNPHLISREIDHFNKINLSETTRTSAKYIDIIPISRKASNEPELLADDGLHPSGKMYGEWVKQITSVAIDILQPQKEYNK